MTHSVPVLGTGRMGAAMARKLHGSGLDLTLYNRNAVIAVDAASSSFVQYKRPAFEHSPALVHLDWKPTFTWHLLRKDFELGLELGRELDVPLPTAALVHQMVVDGIGRGRGDEDFAALLELAAEGAGVELEPEDVDVPTDSPERCP